MVDPPLHPDCRSLAPLIGVWRGEGEGDYPTIDAFRYVEELIVSHVGKPFLALVQATRDAADGRPLHSETGYLRPQPDGTVELVMVQPSGVLEIDSGPLVTTADGMELDMTSIDVSCSPTAKSVTEVRRRLVVSGDELVSDVWMAAVSRPMEKHLNSVLRRR